MSPVHDLDNVLKGLNYGQIRSFKAPLAPLGEQERIVSSIAHMLSQAHIVEKAVLDGLRQTEYLEQSILAKAFRGELLQQDPNDEPASVLLERIGAQRATMTKKGKHRLEEFAGPATITPKA
jgi:type I restriction enzyme S subunit